MKRIVASVGVAALGAASLNAGEIAATPGKPWSVSATLRGFYDDNIGGLPKDSEVESFGFEVNPSIAFTVDTGATQAKAGYSLSYKQFGKSPPGHDQGYYLVHMFRGDLMHQFSERYQISLTDSFVIGQEPDLLQGGSIQPIPGDNIRNFGAVTFNGWLTPTFGLEVGYDNGYWNYDADVLSALLDRIQHNFHIEGKWRVLPQTQALIGYQFGLTDYLGGSDSIGGSFVSSDRNYRSHAFYAGATHQFRPDLSGSLKAGAKFLDYYNSSSDENFVSPYLVGSLRYMFTPDSSVEGGVRYDITSTDIVAPSGTDFTHHGETAVIWASLHHQITPRLHGSLIAQYQNSTYQGGAADGESDNYYSFGANLEYWINPHLAAHIGYNLDIVESDVSTIDRDYRRNRVYIGMTGRY